jgi:hypothetical protein
MGRARRILRQKGLKINLPPHYIKSMGTCFYLQTGKYFINNLGISEVPSSLGGKLGILKSSVEEAYVKNAVLETISSSNNPLLRTKKKR